LKQKTYQLLPSPEIPVKALLVTKKLQSWTKLNPLRTALLHSKLELLTKESQLMLIIPSDT